MPREKRALGTDLGLTRIGVNLTTLPPGKESSMRHFHTHEDERVPEKPPPLDPGKRKGRVGRLRGWARPTAHRDASWIRSR